MAERLAPLSITGQDKIQKGFGEVLGHIEFVEVDDIAGLSAAIDATTCGVIYGTGSG
jgi:acetylornithine/succinyldiaminopimelate/putrescine aminotransferase